MEIFSTEQAKNTENKFGKMKVKVNVPETFEDVVREEYKATPAAPCSRDYYLLISVILEPTARPVS